MGVEATDRPTSGPHPAAVPGGSRGRAPPGHVLDRARWAAAVGHLAPRHPEAPSGAHLGVVAERDQSDTIRSSVGRWSRRVIGIRSLRRQRPPLAGARLQNPLRVFIDPDLFQYPEVWAAAGTWHDVFGIEPRTPVEASKGLVTDLKRG